jgi:hypothetical protein
MVGVDRSGVQDPAVAGIVLVVAGAAITSARAVTGDSGDSGKATTLRRLGFPSGDVAAPPFSELASLVASATAGGCAVLFWSGTSAHIART